jgi:peptidoglycan/xylan/chitin deacetylase (PgdA/CDA1 family)
VRASPRPRLTLFAFAAGILALIAACYVLSVWPASTLYGPVTSRGPGTERLVALTFDDGPSEPTTAAILDVLAREGAPATFFMVGANVEAAPELARRAVSEGHVVANHSFRHRKRDALLDVDYGEAERTQQAIERAAGVRPAFYRPPNGFHTPWQLAAVRRAGMRTVVWDVDPYDWKRPAPETIARRVLDGVHPGSIVLLHDGDDTRQGTDRTPTIEALPLIIGGLRARGYRIVTVAELLGIPAYQERSSTGWIGIPHTQGMAQRTVAAPTTERAPKLFSIHSSQPSRRALPSSDTLVTAPASSSGRPGTSGRR